MSLRAGVFGALLVLGIIAGAKSGSAQTVLATLDCSGTYPPFAYRGLVIVDVFRTGGDTSKASIQNMTPYLMRGEIDRIPGRVHLFGDLRDQNQNRVNFEVFLHPNGQGTGSTWVNDMRHRETYMQLVLKPGGFNIFPEIGGVAQFTCQEHKAQVTQ